MYNITLLYTLSFMLESISRPKFRSHAVPFISFHFKHSIVHVINVVIVVGIVIITAIVIVISTKETPIRHGIH